MNLGLLNLKSIRMRLRFCYTGLLALASILCACGKSASGGGGNKSTPPTLPVISISSVTQVRDTVSGSTFTFAIDLNQQATDTVTVAYQTADSSAVAGVDYSMASGTVTFTPGNTLASIKVNVTPSNVRACNSAFRVLLSSAVNGTLKTPEAVGVIENQGNNLGSDPTGYQTPTSYIGYNAVWSDEFNESTVNTNYWQYDLGNSGWGNNELECYTDSNATLAGGFLTINVRKENVVYNGVTSNYTSTRMNTEGKFSFQYGRVDIRAKLPVQPGMWPALWFLGNNIGTAGWPSCGETDLMELIGTNPNQVVGSIHWQQANGQEGTLNNSYTLPAGADYSQQFHVFSLIWTPTQITMYVDDLPYMSESNTSISSGKWPFNQPQFLIMNCAVGGNWPGPPTAQTTFPEAMIVDYVRVFQ